ncbi:uncharacterized protein IL334_000207 [Kwoniella shivajii]|uniref:Uncharacterized protein n=1 Tax=Kwoniella shivajii TaxID=564305 RepID=A0ABZ1CPM1_9TREE|nr:hypothetical protein IL334_000207 [Kwoniella shivajii]
MPHIDPSTKPRPQNTVTTHDIRFIDPFKTSIPSVTSVNYVCPLTTSRIEPPVFPPLSSKFKRCQNQSSSSVGFPTKIRRNTGPIYLPTPRRLSKDEVKSPLIKGRTILRTLETSDGKTVVRPATRAEKVSFIKKDDHHDTKPTSVTQEKIDERTV